MKTKTIIYNLLIVTLVVLTGCSKSDNRFTGSDNMITVSRELPAFTKVAAETSLEVNIIQSSTQFVEVMVNDNLQEQLITNVSKGILFISLADGNYRNDNFVVNIELPILERLELDDDTRSNVNFTSDQLEFDINDSSELNLEGSSEILNVSIDDDGKISAFAFTAEVVNADVNDDSELQISCTKELNGTVNDSSEIRYKGTPTINVETSDDGQIINAN